MPSRLIPSISMYCWALLNSITRLPEVGASYGTGDDCAVVESVKAASDVYAPIAGEVIEVNEALGDAPEILNSDPYGDGWLFKMTISDKEELNELLDASAYEDLIASEEH